MVRVLHSVSVMNRAGIETMLMNYYRHIDRSKLQFDFLTSRSEKGDYDDEIKALGGNVFTSPSLNPLLYPNYIKYIEKLLSQNSDIKIVHAHNEGMALYALNGAKKFGIKNRIAHAHNTKIVKDYKWPLKVFCKQFLRYSANRLWACGTDAGVYFFGKKSWANNGMLMHNAIETEKFAFNETARNTIRNGYNISDNTLIGMVGRFNKQKNHIRMLDIFSEYLALDPNAKLVFIGEGNLKNKIRQTAKSKGIYKNIIFAGLQSNVNEWYQAMDILVMPSLFEGLPVVGIEAQASGLPCVFSSPVTDEILLTENAIKIPLKQSNKLWAQKIQRLANTSTCRENGVNSVKKAGYDIEIEAKKIQEIYLAMAGEQND